MIIGIDKVKEIADKIGCTIAEVVYGRQHMKENHKNGDDSYYYKPRYLKTFDPESGEMYAFPGGLPGYDEEMKVHLIGHSMGALTAQQF
jgi:hypothetical protein